MNNLKSKKIVIIGGGVAGLQFARTMHDHGYDNFIILEKNPSVIKKNSWKTFERTVNNYELHNCVYLKTKDIHFRTIDIDSLAILQDSIHEIDCYVLNSDKVYKQFENTLGSFIKTNEQISKITRTNGGYEIVTNGIPNTANDSHKYEADIIIDASGAFSVTDKLLQNDFRVTSMYTCYCKRFSSCESKHIMNSAYFDFDDAFKLMGSWVYPIDDNTAEIGIARFVGFPELSQPDRVNQIENLFAQYLKMDPYDKVFKNAKYQTTIQGYAPLLPRLELMKNNIYFLGDTKGAVPYSGYGVENALDSGKECALSLLNNKPYTYFKTPPAKGLGILQILWRLDGQFRLATTGISMLDKQSAYKFFTGDIDMNFFFKCAKISRSQGINTLKHISKGMLLRILLGLKPHPNELQFHS